MAKELKRIPLEPDTDLVRVVRAVHADKAPRLIEDAGEPLAVVIDPSEYDLAARVPTSKRRRTELLALAGAWMDLDGEGLIEHIYRARHEAPPSPPREV